MNWIDRNWHTVVICTIASIFTTLCIRSCQVVPTTPAEAAPTQPTWKVEKVPRDGNARGYVILYRITAPDGQTWVQNDDGIILPGAR